MYSDSQSESDDENEAMLQNHEADSHSLDAPHQQHDTTTIMPLAIDGSWTRANEENVGCCSTSARATRRLRITWALLVGIAILGMSMFSSSNEASTERSVSKKAAFDVNAPPGLEERVYRKQVYAPPQDDILEEPIRLEGNVSELPFPVIEADDDLPLSAAEKRAVDALECRESVINFVINATDAKDECNGLKKAFDMTCNSDTEMKTSADPEKPSGQRRRLFERKTRQKTSLTLKLYQVTRSLRDFARAYLLPSSDDDFFFPENEVAGNAWEEAEYQVLNDYDAEVHDSTRRKLQAEMTPHYYDVPRMRFLEESLNVTEQEQVNATAVNETAVSKPSGDKKVSLSMPTNKVHASDQMLSDTFMLSKEKDIEAAIKASSNQTNATLTAAQEDAVASAKAVHDTAAAVSALFNDPESVEARTCCASILNVYHEHCDTTESHEISDSNLFLIVFIIAFCGVVKSLIRHFKIRWLPEAAGCILVGVLFGGVVSFIPHYDLSFDGDWFLRIMVPPIGKCV